MTLCAIDVLPTVCKYMPIHTGQSFSYLNNIEMDISDHKKKVVNVALVGSSGGGTAAVAADPVELIRRIHEELGKVRYGKTKFILKYALLISLADGSGLDFKVEQQMRFATLYGVGCAASKKGETSGKTDTKQQDEEKKNNVEPKFPKVFFDPELIEVVPLKSSTLNRVNEIYRDLDESVLARAIENGECDALISISSDPLGINSATFKAAAKMNIPCTGSGGTSLALISSTYGIKLCGNAGGSVATSTFTKAVSFVHALSTVWEAKYSPFYLSRHTGEFHQRNLPTLKSVLEACLPAFIAVCVLLRCLDLYASKVGDFDGDVFGGVSHLKWFLEWHVLPTVCCIVAAYSYAPEHGIVVLMPAAISSCVCGGSVIAALLTGRVIAYLVGRTMYACIRLKIPATMTNIIVAGGTGVLVSTILSYSRIVVAFCALTQLIRGIIQVPMPTIRGSKIRGAGFLFGCCFFYGSKIGCYHSMFLPFILIEMERGRPSLFGSIDECTLVIVSAGICAANLVCSNGNNGTEKAVVSTNLCTRGLLTNILCGDFIEVAYPFMDADMRVGFSAYLASGVGTEIIYSDQPRNVLSSAYLPLPLSIWLADDWKRLGLAYLITFAIAFTGTLASNLVSRYRHKQKTE